MVLIYSDSNLKVVAVASTDSHDRALNGVRFEADGSTVASNGRMLMAVGPVKGGVKFPATAGERMSIGKAGLVVAVDAVNKALRYMAKGKTLALRHIALTTVPDPARVGFTSLDAKGDPTTIGTLPKVDKFPDWRAILRRLGRGKVSRVALNRRDLIELLKALEAASSDSGDVSPVFLEIGEGGVIARTVNRATDQRIIGALNVYKVREGSWLERDDWEESIFKTKRKKEPPRRRGGSNGR